jgi:hypothetical protein
MSKAAKNLNQNRRCPDRNPNRVPPNASEKRCRLVHFAWSSIHSLCNILSNLVELGSQGSAGLVRLAVSARLLHGYNSEHGNTTTRVAIRLDKSSKLELYLQRKHIVRILWSFAQCNFFEQILIN